jgi:hypothetical protein
LLGQDPLRLQTPLTRAHGHADQAEASHNNVKMKKQQNTLAIKKQLTAREHAIFNVF